MCGDVSATRTRRYLNLSAVMVTSKFCRESDAIKYLLINAFASDIKVKVGAPWSTLFVVLCVVGVA